MSAEEFGASAATFCPQPPISDPWVREGDSEEEEEEDVEKDMSEGTEAKSLPRGSSDASDDSEPEPLSVRRKVSFADAFGLDLVSVKEFDSGEASGETHSVERPLGGESREGEEYYLRCVFSVPLLPEELQVRLQRQQVELESLELLPGTTMLRGVVRVANLCFHKSVYVRTSLDRWQSHFDLQAEFVPGSSDGTTDRFAFLLTLVPPFDEEGTRVEFCLRYETTIGTFWANNNDMNYVLFFYQKEKREMKERETEDSNLKGKRSCLKVLSKRGHSDVKAAQLTWEISDPASHDVDVVQEYMESLAAKQCRPSQGDDFDIALVASRKRRQAGRPARVKDYLSRRQTEAQPQHISNGQGENGSEEMPQIGLPVWGRARGKASEGAPPVVLSYHQVPLLSLDWARQPVAPGSTPSPWVSRGTDSERPEEIQPAEEPPPGDTTAEAWEAFLNKTDTAHNTDSTHLDTAHTERVLKDSKHTGSAQLHITYADSAPPVTVCKDSVRSKTAHSNTTHHHSVDANTAHTDREHTVSSLSRPIGQSRLARGDSASESRAGVQAGSDTPCRNVREGGQGGAGTCWSPQLRGLDDPRALTLGVSDTTPPVREPEEATGDPDECMASLHRHARSTETPQPVTFPGEPVTADGPDKERPGNSPVRDRGSAGERHGDGAATGQRGGAAGQTLTFTESGRASRQGETFTRTRTRSPASLGRDRALQRQDKEAGEVSKEERENRREEREDTTQGEMPEGTSANWRWEDGVSLPGQHQSAGTHTATASKWMTFDGQALDTAYINLRVRAPEPGGEEEKDIQGIVNERAVGVGERSTLHRGTGSSEGEQEVRSVTGQEQGKQYVQERGVTGESSKVLEKEGEGDDTFTHTTRKETGAELHSATQTLRYGPGWHTTANTNTPKESVQCWGTGQTMARGSRGENKDQGVEFAGRGPELQGLGEEGEMVRAVPRESGAAAASVVCCVPGLWGEICPTPLLCLLLLVVFVTAYFCELPSYLAIYLLPVFWWCGQRTKHHIPSAEGVD